MKSRGSWREKVGDAKRLGRALAYVETEGGTERRNG